MYPCTSVKMIDTSSQVRSSQVRGGERRGVNGAERSKEEGGPSGKTGCANTRISRKIIVCGSIRS